MSIKDVNRLNEALSTPLGDLISEMGKSVADAQHSMDKQTLALLEDIYANDEAYLDLLREMGYRPNWYHIPKAEAEIQMNLTVSGQYSKKSSASRLKMYAAPMNATYQNSFDYNLSASSKMKMTIVPVPEPASLESRKVMPLLTGFTLGEAQDLLDKLDISYTSDSQDKTLQLSGYTPEAGSILDNSAEATLMTGG